MKKFVWKSVKTILLAFFLYILIGAIVENTSVNKQITTFKNKGIFQADISTEFQKYYQVPYESWQEHLPAFTSMHERQYPGTSGDIICNLNSAIELPIIESFITFFAGGHTVFCCYEYEDYAVEIDPNDCMETSGLGEIDETTYTPRSYFDSDYTDSYIGIRAKTTEDKKRQAFNYLVSNLNVPYNYSYIFNQNNSFYCSDYISKAYDSVGLNLNKDLLAVTIYDLIVSDDTYIFLYKETIKGVEKYYYLG